MLTVIIIALVSVVAGVVAINKLSDPKEQDVVQDPPFDGEPIVVLDPPALPTFPDIIYWELMDCIQIEAKIDEIKEFLMTSKFPQEVYEFWIDQLDRGYIVFAEKCIRTEDTVF